MREILYSEQEFDIYECPRCYQKDLTVIYISDNEKDLAARCKCLRCGIDF